MTAPANTNTTPRSEQAAGSAVPVIPAHLNPLLHAPIHVVAQRIVILEETLRSVLGMAKLEAPHSDAWLRAVAMIDEALRDEGQPDHARRD